MITHVKSLLKCTGSSSVVLQLPGTTLTSKYMKHQTHDIRFISCVGRIAKRKLDDHSFMGGVLHVCYAPEYETVTDTREKLNERRSTIENKLTGKAPTTK